MTTIKQLPKGIPQGYKPQKQNVEESPAVLVSEWARNAAHDLDYKHRGWAKRRQEDKYADQNLAETTLREDLDHLAILLSYDMIKSHLAKARNDRSALKAYIKFLNATRGYIARKPVGEQQWAAHKIAHQAEMAYKSMLCDVLGQRLKELNIAANNTPYRFSGTIETDLDAAVLIHGLLRKKLKFVGNENITDEEQRHLDMFEAYLHKRKIEVGRNAEIRP